jgi:hypothetical protein
MREFWKLVKESIIIRAIIALALVGTACYLTIIGREIPDWLYVTTGTVVGSFFGSRPAASSK